MQRVELERGGPQAGQARVVEDDVRVQQRRARVLRPREAEVVRGAEARVLRQGEDLAAVGADELRAPVVGARVDRDELVARQVAVQGRQEPRELRGGAVQDRDDA